MKNIFKSIMCIAAAAMAFTACSTADINEEITTPQTITVKFNAHAENMTRTTFGDYDSTNKEYPTLWQGGEKIMLALGLTTGNDSSPVVASADNTSASFEAEFETTEEAPYTLYAICPSSAWVSGINASYKSWTIDIPTTQTPTTATSCDPKAQILYGKAENLASLTEDVNISFKHLVAYAKFSFSNLNLDGATIQNITIEGDKKIASRYYFYVETNTIGENSASNLITINTTSYEDIWVALAPVEGLSKLTFTINTDKGPLKKTVNLPAGKAFEAGKVAGFTVDMSGVEFEESVKYELLTDFGKLAIGDNVIIAAAEADSAISTTQNGNNRAATSVTKDGDYIVDPSNSVEIFTVGEGIVANTYSLQDKDDQYIYAASSSKNYLRSEADLTNNSSWAITVTDTGVATIISQGEFSRNTIKYNNGSNVFSCYASGQQDVAIYYKSNGGVVPPKTPVINAENPEAVAADVTTITIPYTVSNPVDGKELTVTESVDWVTAVAVGDAEVTLTITANESEEARETTITLSYEGATDKVVTISQNGVYVAPEPGTETATIDFSTKYDANTKVDNTDISVDENITIIFKQGTAGTPTQYYTSSQAVRMYQNGATLDVTAKEGKTITSVEFTFANSMWYIGADSGSLSEEKAVRTWTGEATSVKFTTTGTTSSTRAYVKSITVTYKEAKIEL